MVDLELERATKIGEIFNTKLSKILFFQALQQKKTIPWGMATKTILESIYFELANTNTSIRSFSLCKLRPLSFIYCSISFLGNISLMFFLLASTK